MVKVGAKVRLRSSILWHPEKLTTGKNVARTREMSNGKLILKRMSDFSIMNELACYLGG